MSPQDKIQTLRGVDGQQVPYISFVLASTPPRPSVEYGGASSLAGLRPAETFAKDRTLSVLVDAMLRERYKVKTPGDIPRLLVVVAIAATSAYFVVDRDDMAPYRGLTEAPLAGGSGRGSGAGAGVSPGPQLPPRSIEDASLELRASASGGRFDTQKAVSQNRHMARYREQGRGEVRFSRAAVSRLERRSLVFSL